jgi:hypothetical protein
MTDEHRTGMNRLNPFEAVCLSESVECGGCFFAWMGWVRTPQT